MADHDELEKPPSPILKITRILHSSKLQRKSRVKLTDRFPKSSSQPTETFSDQPLATSFESTSVEAEDKILEEASEHNRNLVVKDFDFKKPESPASCTKKFQAQRSLHGNDLSGFKTAGGNRIRLPEDVITKSKNLFDDILKPNNQIPESRSNKFAFLSKAKVFGSEQKGNLCNEQEKDVILVNKVGTSENGNTIDEKQSLGQPRFLGFKTASGKGVQMNDAAHKIASKIFGEEFDAFKPLLQNSNVTNTKNSDELIFLNTQETNELLCDFVIKEEQVSKITEKEEFKEFKGQLIDQNRKDAEECERNFSTKIPIALNNTQDKFRQELNDFGGRGTSVGFAKASGKTIHTNESALIFARTKFRQDFEETSGDRPEFSAAKNEYNIKGAQSIASVAVSDDFRGFDAETIAESRTRADKFMQDLSISTEAVMARLNSRLPLNDTLTPKTYGFSAAPGTMQIASNKAPEKALQIKFQCGQFNDENVKLCSSFQSAAGNSLKMSEDVLSKARHLFYDVDLSFENCSKSVSIDQENASFEGNSSNLSRNSTLSNTKVYKRKRLGVSRCKQIPVAAHKVEQAMRLFEVEKSTIMSPIRQSAPVIYSSTPLRSSSFAEINTDITPIKSVCSKTVPRESERRQDVDDRFLIQEWTKGSIDSWSTTLENEKRALEIKLKTIEDKQKALFFQKCCTENNNQDQRIKRNGVLFSKKQARDRVSLVQFIKVDPSFRSRLNVNPQNAELVHFRCRQDVAVVMTLDGARIVPNSNHCIGLSEIEVAFKIMPGVDPKLIPQGWIRNHFKWIVWKLASYENFSSNLKDCVLAENVVQQLKYRYDREIDRAERSTLRKIYEMDDAPQKRMVLCVSNVFNLQDEQFELELTDGWYSIRTVIDKPLCRQVTGRKVQIGTKLITCGAELVNCEGCHPLQATAMVRLKINCNSTRRTRWYTKLGYQKCPEPFPVKVCSVYPDGGIIGCIKIYIARVYPVKYMEKQNKQTVWRNRKAEELRAQDWENKGRQDLEKFRESITKDYERSMCKSRQNQTLNMSDVEIKKISCPETLFTLCENHNDPERLEEILTSSQKVSVMDYRRRFLASQHRELSRKLADTVCRQEIPQRDVSPVLQVLVIDVLDPDEKSYVFQIWRPGDVHLEIVKESSVLSFYNVLPKRNGVLCTMNRTKFQIEHIDSSRFNKYKRTLLPIAQLSVLGNKPLFNEFDTVGVVVTMSTNNFTQSLWLSDPSGRLLFIKIFESSKNCLLLDKLKLGQLVAASNLIFCESNLEFGEATANHLTIFASYPQAKHLQEGIDTLAQQLPKDMKLFLEECNQRILYCFDKIDITKRHKVSTSLAQSNNSSIPSDIFDESSDALFSMIDVDKYK